MKFNKVRFSYYQKQNLLFFVPILILILLLFVVPLIILFAVSLGAFGGEAPGDAYQFLFRNTTFVIVFFRSLLIGIVVTVISVIIGYPVALWLAKIDRKFTLKTAIFLLICPLFLNSLIKILAWRAIFIPLHLINTDFAVVFGITYLYIPFFILALYNSLITIDRSIIESSHDLKASRIQTFFRIIFPLSLPGLFSGLLLVFLPAITTAIVPYFLGSRSDNTIGNYVVRLFSTDATSLPIIAAVSIILVVAILFLVVLLKLIKGFSTKKTQKRKSKQVYDVV